MRLWKLVENERTKVILWLKHVYKLYFTGQAMRFPSCVTVVKRQLESHSVKHF